MADYPDLLCANLIQAYSAVYLRNSANTALTEDTVYRLTHLTDRARGSCWKGATGVSEQRIVWDMGSTITCDTVVLDKGFTLTGCTHVYVEHCATDASSDGSWTEAKDISSPDNASVYWYRFTAATKRWWRIRLISLTAQPVIQNFWLGKHIQLTFGPQSIDPYAAESVGSSVVGASGGTQQVPRYSRRFFRAFFQDLKDNEYDLLMGTSSVGGLWTQAWEDRKNWWWLQWPGKQDDDVTDSDYFPLYLNCRGTPKDFPFDTTRSGVVEAWEVK